MKAVIYARYSSDSQREESIEGQLRECTEYAERNGMSSLTKIREIYEQFKDSCRSDERARIEEEIALFDSRGWEILVVALVDFLKGLKDQAGHSKVAICSYRLFYPKAC